MKPLDLVQRVLTASQPNRYGLQIGLTLRLGQSLSICSRVLLSVGVFSNTCRQDLILDALDKYSDG